LAFAHKLDAFHLVMGLCSSWWIFLFPGCKWGEWDSCPFHNRDPNTYAASIHALIRSFLWMPCLAPMMWNDALPTPRKTQMWVQVEDNERGRSWGTLPSSQHFEG
jgi:hypothetical protein